MTDREALEQKVYIFLNSVKHQFPGDDGMLMTIAAMLVTEIIEAETAQAYAKGRKEAVEKALWRVKAICAEYPTNEKTNIPYRVVREACDTALAEGDAKEKEM